MSTDVPRRATFDDLRVGQIVARVYTDGEVWAGVVVKAEDGEVRVSDGREHPWRVIPLRHDCQNVTILRDAPAPPVTVRREDYDALVEALDRASRLAEHKVIPAARALIDNADTGTDDA